MKKFITVLGTLGVLAACGGTTIPMVGGDLTPRITNQDQSFGTILNNLRIGNGAATVTYDARLDAAAQGHADDMVANGYFTHDADGNDNDGVDTNVVGDRVTAQGYNWVAVGENLAGRQQTEESALTAWENSPDHDAMMNATTLSEFGLGVAGSGNDKRWVLVMATEG